MAKNHKYDIIEYWIIKKYNIFYMIISNKQLYYFLMNYSFKSIKDKSNAVSHYYNKENFSFDYFTVLYDQEYNQCQTYTAREKIGKVFYENEDFKYKITRIGNVYRINKKVDI